MRYFYALILAFIFWFTIAIIPPKILLYVSGVIIGYFAWPLFKNAGEWIEYGGK